MVKKDLEVLASSLQPIEVEEIIPLDAKESNLALTIYIPPISPTLEEPSSPSLFALFSPEIQIEPLSLPIIESRHPLPPHLALSNFNEESREELPPSPPHV